MFAEVPAAMDDDELLQIIRREVEDASDSMDDRADNWAQARSYFYAEAPGMPTEEELELGMSDIVSTDVQDAVYAVQAEVMPAFWSGSPVEFLPLSADDEEQASRETRAVNFRAHNAGVDMAVNQAVMSAMLLRAGVCKVWWDESVRVRYETATRIPQQQVPAFLQEGPNQRVEIVSGQQHEDGTVSGVKRVYEKKSVCRVEAVPLDEFLVTANTASTSASEARLQAHQRPVYRSDLMAQGYDPDVVLGLKAHDIATDSKTVSRARTSRDTELTRSGQRNTMSDYVQVCESYMRLDRDGDGIAELLRIVTAGGDDGTDELLDVEPVDDDPFAVGVGYLGLFSWDGVSLFDRLKLVQDIKTPILRDMVNATRRNMRQRIGVVEGDGYVEDIFDSQMGGAVRARTNTGIFALPDVQVPQSAFALIQYLDQMRSDRGGGAIDATQSAQAIANGGDWSLERIQSAIEQINAMVAKNLTETLVKPVYKKLHALMRKYEPGMVIAPGGTEGWEQSQPAQWPERQEMMISMGMSVGERTRRVGILSGVLQQQQQDVQQGMNGITVDMNGVYQARLDILRLSGIPNPEQYWVDPQSQQSQQAQQAQAQQAEQAQQQAQQQAQAQMEFQYRMLTDIERIRAESRSQIAQLETSQKTLSDQMSNAIKIFSERVELAGIEQQADATEAQQEIDRLQAVRSIGGVK